MRGYTNNGLCVVIIVALLLIGLAIIVVYRPLIQPPAKNQSPSLCPGGLDCIKPNGSMISKDNLSIAQQKLSTDLLQLTDSRYLPAGMTLDVLEQQMEQNHQFTYIPETGNALVYVYIKTNENADSAKINSSVWNVTNTDPEHHLVVAWVDVNNLTKLASYDFIESVQSVSPPVTVRETGS
ncbi:MAG: hypothetical protein ABSG28_05055 [Methanoregula sp.]|jgi:hypothetical protein|uniref:hypothetical protein n=1 Tax=Methanoregula sp. TaxID=2052170 RepID=UPI003C1569BD